MTPATRTLAWLRQFAKLWGFALFCVLIVYIFREVVLPFLFAILVAYILAPLVDRFSRLRVGGKPFPRAAAVIILYINIIAVLSLFIGYFVPKLSGDFARRFKVDLESLAFEVRPASDGRYLIAPPQPEERGTGPGGKWERSIKQWMSQRLRSTEG